MTTRYLLIEREKGYVMTKETTNRSSLLQVRLTPEEMQRLQKKWKASTCRKLSDYVRRLLQDRPITVNTRNQSLDDFMVEMIVLRKELNSLGNNYNQVVKRLHTIGEKHEVNAWLLLNETSKKILLAKINEIKSKINQINDQWLQG